MQVHMYCTCYVLELFAVRNIHDFQFNLDSYVHAATATEVFIYPDLVTYTCIMYSSLLLLCIGVL